MGHALGHCEYLSNRIESQPRSSPHPLHSFLWYLSNRIERVQRPPYYDCLHRLKYLSNRIERYNLRDVWRIVEIDSRYLSNRIERAPLAGLHAHAQGGVSIK